MDKLTFANTILIGLLFVIWSKDEWHNVLFKCVFLTLFILNLLRLVGKI